MVTLEGNPLKLAGQFPSVGQEVKDFTLVDGALQEVKLSQFLGNGPTVLNIFPSLDTDVCANSVREFEGRLLDFPDVKILSISKDLPFAQKRFCLNQNIQRVLTLSGFRNQAFGEDYGVQILDGPIQGLFARAVLLLDEKGKVVYRELVSEITQEPHYQGVVEALQKL